MQNKLYSKFALMAALYSIFSFKKNNFNKNNKKDFYREYVERILNKRSKKRKWQKEII